MHVSVKFARLINILIKLGLGKCMTCPAGKIIKTEQRNSNVVSYVKTGTIANEAKNRFEPPTYY